MRDAADVPQLHENAPARLVHRARRLAPALDLGLAVEAGRPDVALPLLADLRGLGDDQPGAGALTVIGGGEVVGGVGPGVARLRVNGAITIRLGKSRSPSRKG